MGTIEDPDIPFSSISVLKQHAERDMTYKIFSRQPMDDALLDVIFRYLSTVEFSFNFFFLNKFSFNLSRKENIKN